MLKDIVEAARALFDRQSELQRRRKEVCEKLGGYLADIGTTLREVAEGVKVGEVSVTKVAELATFAELLPKTLGKQLRLMEMNWLVNTIKQAHEVISLKSRSKRARDRAVARIEEAAGVLTALGMSCRLHHSAE